jgi:hypothetical protein
MCFLPVSDQFLMILSQPSAPSGIPDVTQLFPNPLSSGVPNHWLTHYYRGTRYQLTRYYRGTQYQPTVGRPVTIGVPNASQRLADSLLSGYPMPANGWPTRYYRGTQYQPTVG